MCIREDNILFRGPLQVGWEAKGAQQRQNGTEGIKLRHGVTTAGYVNSSIFLIWEIELFPKIECKEQTATIITNSVLL